MVAGIVLIVAVLLVAIFLARGLATEHPNVKEHTQDEFFDLNGKGEYAVQAVGESHYQDSLRAVTAGHAGYVEIECEAELYCEDDNAYDANAVRVMIQGRTVGYLSRTVASFYRDTIRNAGFGKATGKCRARIFGGSREKPSYGVWLDI